MEEKKPGRKKGSKNSTVTLRKQVAAAYASNSHGVTTASCADHFRIAASTVHSWLRTDVAMEDARHDTAVTVPRNTRPRATLAWLRTVVGDGTDVPAVAEIQQTMARLEPDYAANANYSAIRRAAERVRRQVLKEVNGYVSITRSIGQARLPPAATCAPHCACRGKCGDACTVRQGMHECDDALCRNGPDCGNRAIQRSVAPAVEKRDATDRRGCGLFAKEVIQPHQFVQEYVGAIVSAAEKTELDKRGRGLYILALGNGFYIDAMHYGNSSRFFQHAHDSNCRAELWWVKQMPRVGIFAKTVIRPGTELTISYGTHCRMDQCACSTGRT